MKLRATLRAILNYIPAILTFLGGAAAIVGIVPDLSGLFGVSSKTAVAIGHVGDIIFVASLAWSVGAVASSVANLSDLYRELAGKVKEFGEQEHYGHAIQHLQELSKSKQHHGTVEAASSTALRIAEKIGSGITPRIRSYSSETGGQMDIDENYVISNILESLSSSPEALPKGAVWLGVSRLGAGWKKRAELDAGFREFDRNLDRLARERKIQVFRIYCAPRKDQNDIYHNTRNSQCKGVKLRFLAEDEANSDIRDISIVLRRGRFSSYNDSLDPISALDNYERLYALSFVVPTGIMVQRMTFTTPGDPAFQYVVDNFRNAWGKSEPITLCETAKAAM